MYKAGARAHQGEREGDPSIIVWFVVIDVTL